MAALIGGLIHFERTVGALEEIMTLNRMDRGGVPGWDNARDYCSRGFGNGKSKVPGKAGSKSRLKVAPQIPAGRFLSHPESF